MNEHLGMRVLVTVGDNDAPRMTAVQAISPNGKYVQLDDVLSCSETLGWQPIAAIKVLDVIGPIGETLSQIHARLAR